MEISKRKGLVLGVVLVIIGAVFVAANIFPEFSQFLSQANSWPMIIEAVAVGLLILGLIIGVPGMAVPAVIVAGIGGILWWQNSTQQWETWSFLWTLIPGFCGLGMLLAKALGGREQYNVWHALNTIGTSLILFAIFGSLFNGFSFMGPYWPVMLIAAGVLIALRKFIRIQ